MVSARPPSAFCITCVGVSTPDFDPASNLLKYSSILSAPDLVLCSVLLVNLDADEDEVPVEPLSDSAESVAVCRIMRAPPQWEESEVEV